MARYIAFYSRVELMGTYLWASVTNARMRPLVRVGEGSAGELLHSSRLGVIERRSAVTLGGKSSHALVEI